MPKISTISKHNEKKLDITPFFKGKLEEGETEVFIYIDKLSYKVKRKIDFLSIETFDAKRQTEIRKKIAKHGFTQEDLLDESKAMEIASKIAVDFKDLGINKEGAGEMFDFSMAVEKMVLENGVNPTKHTFVGEDDKPFILNYDFWNSHGDVALVNYIIKHIKALSVGFSLGE